MSETPTVDEQYSTAVAARSLLIDPVHRTQADVIIAAGWSHARIGTALMRLRTEWDSAARPAKMAAERGAYHSAAKTAKMAATKRAKSRISEEQIEEIRASHESCYVLAARTGISASHIKMIRRYQARRPANNPFSGLLT